MTGTRLAGTLAGLGHLPSPDPYVLSGVLMVVEAGKAVSHPGSELLVQHERVWLGCDGSPL
jgi:hypothetical protein